MQLHMLRKHEKTASFDNIYERYKILLLGINAAFDRLYEKTSGEQEDFILLICHPRRNPAAVGQSDLILVYLKCVIVMPAWLPSLI